MRKKRDSIGALATETHRQRWIDILNGMRVYILLVVQKLYSTNDVQSRALRHPVTRYVYVYGIYVSVNLLFSKALVNYYLYDKAYFILFLQKSRYIRVTDS